MSSDDDLKGDGPPKHVRRESSARREVEEQVVLRQGEHRTQGWCLNMSRGGLRAVIETTVEVGEEFEVTVGEDAHERRARIVWVRATGGGAIVGMAFLDGEGSNPTSRVISPLRERLRPHAHDITVRWALRERDEGARVVGGSAMLSTSDIKRALREAGFEVYRTEGAVVHIADRVRENLIMDSGIRVDGGRDAVVVYVRAQKRDFPGENEEELYGRARALAEPALERGYREARTFMTELLDPGNPERILDLWYQVQLEKSVESLATAVDEVRFAHELVKTSTR